MAHTHTIDLDDVRFDLNEHPYADTLLRLSGELRLRGDEHDHILMEVVDIWFPAFAPAGGLGLAERADELWKLLGSAVGALVAEHVEAP